MTAAANSGYGGAFPVRVIKRNSPPGGAPSEEAGAAARSAEPPAADMTQALAAAQAEIENLKAQLHAQTERQARIDLAHQMPELQILLMEEIGRMRTTLAQIVRSACEKIIGERFTHEEALERCIDASIRDHSAKAPIFLHVAPLDWTTAERVAHKFSQSARALEVRVIQDAEIPTGSCRLETGGLTVEVGLQLQLDLLENLLARIATTKESS